MNWKEYEKYLLAICIWREARGELLTTKIAVAFSILNRVKRPSWWGKCLSEVLAKKFQYSSMAAPGDPNLIKWPTPPDPSFDDCMDAVEQAMSGNTVNPVPGADSYWDDSIPRPKWATDENFIAKIGHISFHNTDEDHEKM